MQVHRTLFLMERVRKRAKFSWIFMNFYNVCKKNNSKKNVHGNCENWALVRTTAQLLQFLGAHKWASKSTLNANMTSTFFLRRDKISQKNHKSSKFQHFRSNWHWHAQKITQNVFTISITLECAKIVTFSETPVRWRTPLKYAESFGPKHFRTKEK